MIYLPNDDRTLRYNSLLINYIKEMHLYNNEKLIYTSKYTDGTFSITNPTSEYINCKLVNGYPHFHIPLDVCLSEIECFLNDESIYEYEFLIRYGDTHPHKTIPKLSQIRNLLIENSLSSMIGKTAKSYYVLGDISIKSLNDFIAKYSLNISAEDLFIRIVNGKNLPEINELLNEYNKKALSDISEFLKKIKLNSKSFLIESNLYTNSQLYTSMKNNPKYKDELKKNGELKYTLQEMMFIKQLLQNDNNILINIIGANQSDHIMRVNSILAEENRNINNRFLTYGICRNGDERDIQIWSSKINEYIETHNLCFGNDYIDCGDFLKMLMIINGTDIIIDFENLNKHYNGIKRMNSIINNVSFSENITCNISENNDLICKMALVSYHLNQAIEIGSPNVFYKYLLSIINEYENNKEKYKSISGLYQRFVIKCIDRLGYPITKQKEGKCRVMTK